MRSDPLVSAIIPTYNRAGVVGEAIDSVVGQSYPNLEVIVVDDGSSDDTLSRLQHFSGRIRIVRQPNSGPAAARNRGISVARGELIAFLDSDDLWLPTKIERQVRLLQHVGDEVPCCVCNIRMCWSDRERTSFDISCLFSSMGEGLWLNPDEVLATRFLLFNQGVMIRRSVLDKIGPFDETLWYLEDHELSLRLSLEGPWAFVDEPLVIWRESMSGSLYQKAQSDELRWRLPMVQILQRQLTHAEQKGGTSALRALLTGELNRAKRQLKAAELIQKGTFPVSHWGKFLQSVEHYRKAVFRRLPSFPSMKVQSIASVGPGASRAIAVPMMSSRQ
jgi:glycosyltransferase involved in cell wall biosynthesis